MPSAEEVAFAGIAEQAALVRTGEISPVELVRLYLERIERLDPALNAFRVVLAERAIEEAGRAESRRAGGEDAPLLGVPVAIKDNVDVEGEVTTMGSRAYGSAATKDAEIVRRLRSAGAIVIGKTMLSELAIWPFTESEGWGVTRNPWNLDRTPGGSSGGSATAVASGMAGIGQASDGGGSIRIPAACCGLFGLKAQRGRVSLMPDPQHWYGLSVFGCVSRTVLDSALFYDIVRGPAPGDAHSAPEPRSSFVEAARVRPERFRIAVSTKPIQPAPVDPEVKRAVTETAEVMRALGHDVRERDPSWGLMLPAFLPRYLAGIRADALRMPHRERLEQRTKRLVSWARLLDGRPLRRALAAEQKHMSRLGALFDEFDVLMTPTLAKLPERAGRWLGMSAIRTVNGVARFVPFTTAWNVTGQPAASVPAGLARDGMPLAVQLVGRPGDETTLISLAAQLESERPWARHKPPTS